MPGKSQMRVLRADSRSAHGGWLFDQPYLLLSLTSLFWAGNVVLGRFVVGHIPPITLSFIRWLGAFAVLLPFAARHLVRDWPVIRRHAWLLAFFALTGFSRLQHHGLLRPAVHHRDQRLVAAIGGAAVRRAVDLCFVSRSSHVAPGLRKLVPRHQAWAKNR